jgi:hypothetical protein
MKKEAQVVSLRGLRVFGCLVLLLGFSLSLGCGGGAAPDPYGGFSDDEKAIDDLISSLADISGRLDALRESFTADAAPSSADAQKMGKHNFRINGDINVTGTTASFVVEIGNYEDGQVVEKTWTATKVGEEWKLSDTPLP